MTYLERAPSFPLNQCVRALWHTRAPIVSGPRQRILPNGCVQIIFNLARDHILDCPEVGADRFVPPSLVVGARSVYEIVDTSDMADLAGIVFEPGGFTPFGFDSVDLFSGRYVDLSDVWGVRASEIRQRLLEVEASAAKLSVLETFLCERFEARLRRSRTVRFALSRFGEDKSVSVEQVASELGCSVRHLSQRFREEVGLSPKVWNRIRRFQVAVRRLHGRHEVKWGELALECGYFDQSHFANEFRAFSGINITAYCANRTQWANHIPAE